MRLGSIACLVGLLLLPPSASRLPVTPLRDTPEGLILAARSAWQWPVQGTLVRRFDPPPKPWLPGHRGVDLAAEEFAIVRAAGPGVVWFAGYVATRPLVSIAHPNGTRTTYEPVRPLVSAGEAVDAGDPIGVLQAGHDGCAEACLHWGLRKGDIYLDPLALLGLSRVRLLPVRGHRLHRPIRRVARRRRSVPTGS